MATLAMCFTPIQRCKADTSTHVLLLSNNFHMIWVQTGANPAQMVQLHAFGPFFPRMNFIGNYVSRHHLGASPEQSVSPAINTSSPKPASRIGLRGNKVV
jgi:hypothetical protein